MAWGGGLLSFQRLFNFTRPYFDSRVSFLSSPSLWWTSTRGNYFIFFVGKKSWRRFCGPRIARRGTFFFVDVQQRCRLLHGSLGGPVKVQTFRVVVVVHRAASNGGPATFFIWHPCTSRARLLLQQSKAHTARLITTGNYRVGVD